MEAPAPTVQYFIAGYGVIFAGLTGYLASLYLRWKKLQDYKRMRDETRQQESSRP